MSKYPRRVLMLALALGVTAAACGNENPTRPNTDPVIFSLTAFPLSIGSPADSAVIICNASDPDGDALVYDWITDQRLRIKGLPPNLHSLYNRSDNFLIVYPGVDTADDTAWVQCFARDGIGGSAARLVNVVVP